MTKHEHNHPIAGRPGEDPTLPDVSLVIGGQERHLCFDFEAICKVEQLTGLNLLKSAVSEVSATNLRALLYAALLRDDPALSLEQVSKWITMHNVANIHQALVTAWFGSVDQQESKDDEPGEAPAQA